MPVLAPPGIGLGSKATKIRVAGVQENMTQRGSDRGGRGVPGLTVLIYGETDESMAVSECMNRDEEDRSTQAARKLDWEQF